MQTGDILASYGAILATVLAFLQWQRDRGRFVLNPVTMQIKTFSGKTIWRIVEVVNTGTRSLYLEDFGYRLQDGRPVSLRDEHTVFPLKLDEGQKHGSMTIDERHLPAEIEVLWARDTTGKEYNSRKFPFKE